MEMQDIVIGWSNADRVFAAACNASLRFSLVAFQEKQCHALKDTLRDLENIETNVCHEAQVRLGIPISVLVDILHICEKNHSCNPPSCPEAEGKEGRMADALPCGYWITNNIYEATLGGECN